MSLIPCKFYAAGNCRFGNNCRFYHDGRLQQQQNQGTSYFGNRTLAPATFQPSQTHVNQGQTTGLSAKSNQNLDIIVEQVKKDMQEWQISQMWPYSVYGPVGGKACIPGFEDLSPEEFRYNFMQCGNTLPPDTIQRFQQLNQLRINYQQPSIDNRNIIERVVKSELPLPQTQSVFGTTQGLGSQPQQQSIFGGGSTPAAPISIFGGSSTQQQQPTSIFGDSTTNQFGQQSTGSFFQSQPVQPTQTTSSGFFGTQTQPVSQPVFGAAAPQPNAATGLFQTVSQPSTGTGLSGLFQTATQPTSLFQQQPPVAQSTPSFFQQPTNQFQGTMFQQPPAPVVSTAQTTTSFFQQTQTQVLQPQQMTGAFQQSQTGGFATNPSQGSMFAPAATSIFGGASAQPPSAPAASNIFGGAAPNIMQNSGVLPTGAPPPYDSSNSMMSQKFIYTNENELSPAELEAFKAPEFSLDSLPLKPPPQSLCL